MRSKETDERRSRYWFFKSDKGHMTTYAVHLHEWTEDEMDSAMRSVLDSITELGKK